MILGTGSLEGLDAQSGLEAEVLALHDPVRVEDGWVRSLEP